MPEAQAGGRWRDILRLVLPVALPVIVLCSSGMASVNHGWAKFSWYAVAASGALTAGAISIAKDRESKGLREDAIQAKTALGMALTGAGQPLIAALARVAAGMTSGQVRSAMDVLINRTVAIAREETGRFGDEECRTRAVFYQFVGRDLELKYCEGRHGDEPRPRFSAKGSDHDLQAIKFANSPNCLIVDDLENNPPPHFIDPKGRTYKAFIAVPVRAGAKSYGMLVTDSNKAFSFTDLDKGYLVVLAGVLAAGLAHQEAIEKFEADAAPESGRAPINVRNTGGTPGATKR